MSVKDDLLSALAASVRSNGVGGLTTAADLRAFLTQLIEAATDSDGDPLVFTSPNQTKYRLSVSNSGQVSTVPIQAPPATGYSPVIWTNRVLAAASSDGTIERVSGGYTPAGALGSLMSSTTITALKASLRFTIYAANGETKCGFNYDRNADADDASIKLAFHVHPGVGVRALGALYGYPFSDYKPIVDGTVAQLDVMQDGSATFLLDNVVLSTLQAGTLTADGLYADCWLYTPGSSVAEVQTRFGASEPTGL